MFRFLLYAFIIVPACIRDVVYDLVAKYRYTVFGQSEYCRMPSPGIRVSRYELQSSALFNDVRVHRCAGAVFGLGDGARRRGSKARSRQGRLAHTRSNSYSE